MLSQEEINALLEALGDKFWEDEKEEIMIKKKAEIRFTVEADCGESVFNVVVDSLINNGYLVEKARNREGITINVYEKEEK